MKNLFGLCFLAAAVLACGAAGPSDFALVNRVSWGSDGKPVDTGRWLDAQLHPAADDGLPAAVQARIASLDVIQKSMADLIRQRMDLRRATRGTRGTPQGAMAINQVNGLILDLQRQTATRSLLRNIYSRNQLKEHLTWFWFNHFNVYWHIKAVTPFLPDYEEHAIRPHVLGKFRDLLAATVFHPAMIAYLNNQQNAVGHINENYARELMELHTMGVGSGYTQHDVQELARILTGLAVDPKAVAASTPGLPIPDTSKGVVEFDSARHDFGDKVLLGQTIKGTGVTEINQAVQLLSRQPATAHFISTQLAQFFCCDTPPAALVAAMTATFQKTDGDIAAVLKTLFSAPQFTASLGEKFKDPMHYGVSALRAAYGDGAPVIVNVDPLMQWLTTLGEPPYGHDTPDGYAITDTAWSGPGALASRFEIARRIGAGAALLFIPPDQVVDKRAAGTPPSLKNSPYANHLVLAANTAGALAKAATPADWNMLFLSSPEFMHR